MVLAGIGGRTIAEAKASLTLTEANTWLAYRRRRGSLNLGLRTEEGFARVLSAIHSLFTKDHVPADIFMPHVVPPAPQTSDGDLSAAFGLLSAAARANRATTTP